MVSVVQVTPHSNYTVSVLFSDGRDVLYNAVPLLESGVFARLKDIDFFMNHCVVLNQTLAWDISGNFDNTTCLDIDPYSIWSQYRG